MAKAPPTKKGTARKGKSKSKSKSQAKTTTRKIDASHQHDRFGEASKTIAGASKAKVKRSPKKTKAVVAQEPKKSHAFVEKATLKTLAPVAKEINVRLEKASKATELAVDHRLAASLLLADAKESATKGGVNFKKWVESNITQGWETARKLAVIGGQDDPRLALEGARAKNAEANKKLRDTNKAAKAKATESASVSRDTTTATLDRLAGFDEACNVFTALSSTDKMTFLNWATGEVGATLSFDLDVEADAAARAADDEGDTDAGTRMGDDEDDAQADAKLGEREALEEMDIPDNLKR